MFYNRLYIAVSSFSHVEVLRDSLSCTEFHNFVEFSFDIDIIPFAVPYRIKSAWHCKFVGRLERLGTNLFDAVNIGVMNIKKGTIPEFQLPWQVWFVEIVEESNRKVLEEDTLVREAGYRTKE
jgi:hypothetical protein